MCKILYPPLFSSRSKRQAQRYFEYDFFKVLHCDIIKTGWNNSQG